MTRRDRLMIVAVFAVALLAAFWMLVLGPQRTAAAEAEGRLNVARTSLTEAQQKLASGRAAEEEFRVARRTVVKLGRVVPESDDIPTLLTQLSAIAKREGVTFTSYNVNTAAGTAAPPAGSESTTTVQDPAGAGSTDAVQPLYAPGSVVMAGGLGRTPIQLEVRGSYFKLERFLRGVQRFAVISAKQTKANGRLLIVDGFSYSPVEDAGGDLKAELAASAYYAPAIPAPDAAATAGSAAPAAGAATPAAAPDTSTGTAVAGGLR